MTFTPNDQSRLNNYDFLRILLASVVIISHSYPLYGLSGGDWIEKRTGGLFTLGSLGVGGFFAISGCLVYQSSQRTPGFRDFITKRFLRIFPGLAVNLVITALLIGKLVSTATAYYLTASPYLYIIRGLSLFQPQFCITGVFETNPYGCPVNGSLWSISYEFLFYLLFAAVYYNRWVCKHAAWLSFCLFAMLLFVDTAFAKIGYVIPHTNLTVNFLVVLMIWFAGGTCIGALMPYWNRYKQPIAAISLLLCFLSVSGVLPANLIYVALPVFVNAFGICMTPGISKLWRAGDPSYGIYIYGFVVQQTLMYLLGHRIGLYSFMFLSLGISLLLGYISWHLVEKNARRAKPAQGPSNCKAHEVVYEVGKSTKP